MQGVPNCTQSAGGAELHLPGAELHLPGAQLHLPRAQLHRPRAHPRPSCIYPGPSCIYPGPSCVYPGPSCIYAGPSCVYAGPSCIFSPVAPTPGPVASTLQLPLLWSQSHLRYIASIPREAASIQLGHSGSLLHKHAQAFHSPNLTRQHSIRFDQFEFGSFQFVALPDSNILVQMRPMITLIFAHSTKQLGKRLYSARRG